MNNIDWSKAPAWATHYGPESDCYCESWYQVIDGKIVTFAEADSAVCVPQPASQGECFYHPIEELVARWLGEGLPPVGTVCEAWHNGSAQGVVEVRYAGDCMVLWNVKLKHEQCSVAKNYSFRPIRAPEQIAADERLHSVRNACTAIAETLDGLRGKTKAERAALAVVEAMIDAGYRRVEQ